MFKNDEAESAIDLCFFFKHTSDFISIVSLKATKPKHLASLIVGNKFSLDSEATICHFFPTIVIDLLPPDSFFLLLHILNKLKSASVEREPTNISFESVLNSLAQLAHNISHSSPQIGYRLLKVVFLMFEDVVINNTPDSH